MCAGPVLKGPETGKGNTSPVAVGLPRIPKPDPSLVSARIPTVK